ncbi:MAG: Ig-like domain-containing protein, partial [Paracoccaceae bacterium]
VTYDPNGAFDALGQGDTAIDTFTYTVTDGNGGTDTETVSVTVTGGNEGPTANPDVADVGEDDTAPTVIDLTGNDSDPDGSDDLEIAAIDDTGTLGTVVVNADNDTVSYDPNGAFESLAAGETAIDTFTYTVTDGNGATDTETVSVTVTGANDLPVAVADTLTTSSSDTVSAVLTGNDSDPDGSDDLEIAAIDDTGTLGTVTVNADNDSVTYDPNGAFDALGQGDTAIDTFTYTVTDGNGGTDTETVSIIVGGENDLPVAVDDDTIVGQGQDVTIDVLTNDSDPNGDTLTVIDVTNGASGISTLNPDGTVTFIFGQLPFDSFTYTVSDGRGGTDTATVSVGQNFAPFLPEPVVFSVPEGTILAADLEAFDVENDPVTYTLAGGPDGDLFTLDSVTGELRFIAAPDFEAPVDADGDNAYFIDVTVADALGSNTQRVEINVTNDASDDLDDAPEITSPVPLAPSQPVRQFLSTVSIGVVTQVEAEDDDLPNGDTLQFRLFGEDAGFFDIDSATGAVSLLAPLTDPFGSFDGDAVYEVEVLVEDSTGQTDTLEIEYLLFIGG